MAHSIRGGFALLIVAALCCSPFLAVSAEEPSRKEDSDKGIVGGIVLEKKDDSIKVKLDGQADPVTYKIDPGNKRLATALKLIFPVARVRLAYKTSDDTRQLAGIEKTGRQGVGTVTGAVLATHEWWVEVKPKNGPPEGYACSYPAEMWKATMEKIKELKEGDQVVIGYFTDFERHRITSIRKIEK
jgi:hypothetical protein